MNSFAVVKKLLNKELLLRSLYSVPIVLSVIFVLNLGSVWVSIFLFAIGVFILLESINSLKIYKLKNTPLLIDFFLALCAYFYTIFYYESQPFFSILVGIIIACVFVTDTMAYMGGKFFGKSLGVALFEESYRLAPSISPNKTKIGAMIGLMSGSLCFAEMLYMYFNINILYGLLLGIVVSAFSICGDLFQSLVKRKLKVKDSGRILGPHGGFWDRFDSLLFAIPVALVGFSIIY